jgi:putative addiction module component (TIGR02574 family)
MDAVKTVSDSAGRIDAMTTAERLDLLERLWESLSRSPEDVPVTVAQRRELDRRMESLARDAEQGAPLGIAWDEVARQIRNRG